MLLASIVGRLRLYSILLLNLSVWAVQHGVGWLCRKQHPLGWTTEQDFLLMLLRTLFTKGTYVHWRNVHKMWLAMNGKEEQQGLKLEAIPSETFGVAGVHKSYWISLDAALLKGVPPAKASCVLLYLHGGGFVAGEPRMYCPTFRHWMQQLAAEGVRMRVLSVGYPMAPEHPFPAAILFVAAAYKWLLQHLEAEGSSDSIIIGGDSAGGNLVLATLAYLRDGTLLQDGQSREGAAAAAAADAMQERVPLPAAAVLISPAVDLTTSSVLGPRLTSYFAKLQPRHGHKQQQQQQQQQQRNTSNKPHWDYLGLDVGVSVAQHYMCAQSEAAMHQPLVSPVLLRSFEGLVQQQMLLVYGGVELMAPDLVAFEATLRAAEAPVQVHVEPNQPHVYCLLPLAPLIEQGARVLVPFISEAVFRALKN